MIQNLSGEKIGNYELRDRLGRGGMAEVYRAWQPGMERFVAVKVMLSHLSEDEQFIERFRREAKAVGGLRHQHIVQVFDFGHDEERGIYYMVMEHIQGGNLKALITREGQLAPAHTLKIGSQLADALNYAHQRSMIHRDLKPANVMFGDDEHQQSILTDFGIARILTETGLTQSGMAVGTPAYMSPEAALGQDIDERADIYALGVMLYEMLTGKVPYSADTPLAVIMKHVNAPLPTRNDFGDLIPENVESVILKAMAKEPDDRYATAGDMRDALDEALEDFTSKAPTRRSVKTPPTPSDKRVPEPAPAPQKKPGPAIPAPVQDTDSITGTQTTIVNQGMPWWVFVVILVLIAVLGGGYLLLEELSHSDSDDDENVAVATVFVAAAAPPDNNPGAPDTGPEETNNQYDALVDLVRRDEDEDTVQQAVDTLLSNENLPASIIADTAYVVYLYNDLAQAEELATRSLEDSNNRNAHWVMALVAAAEGDIDVAIASMSAAEAAPAPPRPSDLLTREFDRNFTLDLARVYLESENEILIGDIPRLLGSVEAEYPIWSDVWRVKGEAQIVIGSYEFATNSLNRALTYETRPEEIEDIEASLAVAEAALAAEGGAEEEAETAPEDAALAPREPGYYAQPFIQQSYEISIPAELEGRIEILRPAIDSMTPHEENLDPTIGLTRLLTERIYPAYVDGAEPEELYGFIDEELARRGDDDYETRLAQAVLDLEFDPANAESLARQLVEEEPEDWRGFVVLSDALMAEANYDPEGAAAAILTAEELVGRGEFEITWRLAERTVTDREEALALFNEAEAAQAGGHRYINFAGRILYDHGDYRRALPYMAIEQIEVFANRGYGGDVLGSAHRIMVSAFSIGVGDEILVPIVDDFSQQDLNVEQYVDTAYIALQVGNIDVAEAAIEEAYALQDASQNPGVLWVEGLIVADDVIGEVDPATLSDGIQIYQGDVDLTEAIALLEDARSIIESGQRPASRTLTVEFERHINTDLAQVYLAAGNPQDVPFAMRNLLDPLIFDQRVEWLHPYLIKAQVQFTIGDYTQICNDTLNVALRYAEGPEVLSAVAEANEEACTLAETGGGAQRPPNGGPPEGEPPNGVPPEGEAPEGAPPPPGEG